MNTSSRGLKKSVLVCLDLEGTLISNAVSQIPRPHLFEFLESLAKFGDIVLYTSVSVAQTSAVKVLLVEEKLVPDWFIDVPSLHPKGTIKSKHFVPNYQDYNMVFLIDDQAEVVNKNELEWLIHIKEFLPPYSQGDKELLCVLEQIKLRLHPKKTFKAGFRPTKDRLTEIGEKGLREMEAFDSKNIEKWSE